MSIRLSDCRALEPNLRSLTPYAPPPPAAEYQVGRPLDSKRRTGAGIDAEQDVVTREVDTASLEAYSVGDPVDSERPRRPSCDAAHSACKAVIRADDPARTS